MAEFKCPVSGEKVELKIKEGGACFFLSEKGGWFSKVFDEPGEAYEWFGKLNMKTDLKKCTDKYLPSGIVLESSSGWRTNPMTVDALDSFKTILTTGYPGGEKPGRSRTRAAKQVKETETPPEDTGVSESAE